MLKSFKPHLKRLYTISIQKPIETLKENNQTVENLLQVTSISGSSLSVALLDKMILLSWINDYDKLFQVIKSNKKSIKDICGDYICFYEMFTTQANRIHYFTLESKEDAHNHELIYTVLANIIDLCFNIWYPDGTLPIALDSSLNIVTLKNTAYLLKKTEYPWMLPHFNFNNLNTSEKELVLRISQSAFENKYWYMMSFTEHNQPTLNISLDILKYYKSIESQVAKHIVLAEDLFYTRKYIVPYGGVILELKNHEIIDRILVNEIQVNDKIYLITTNIRFKDGTEFSYIFDIKNVRVESWIPSLACDLVCILAKFYKLDLEGLKLPDIEYDFTVLTPDYWKYKGTTTNNTAHERTQLQQNYNKLKQMYFIKPFTRKLSSGQKPSKEALERAKKLHIKLEDGYTLVSEHQRLYSVSIK